MEGKTHTIDAKEKSLGRIASVAAQILIGKHRTDFAPNKNFDDIVIIKNAARVKITGRKLEKKVYHHHSGYPGGLKETPMGKVFERDPAEVIRKTIFGMLPKNRLRKKRIRRLKIYQEG